MECAPDAQLLQVIFTVKKRPGMYLWPYSLHSLHSFLDGYQMCCWLNGLVGGERDLMRDFTKWLREQFGMMPSNMLNWLGILLCYSPEGRQGVDFFYQQFEAFLQEQHIEIPEV